MGTIKGLAHIGLHVSDLEASEKFYTEILGFKKYYGWQSKHTKVSLMTLGNVMIEMMQSLEPKEFPEEGRWAHLALAVEDIDSVYADLLKKGIRFTTDKITDSDHWGPTGARYILFHGPDGEIIEIAEAMKK